MVNNIPRLLPKRGRNLVSRTTSTSLCMACIWNMHIYVRRPLLLMRSKIIHWLKEGRLRLRQISKISRRTNRWLHLVVVDIHVRDGFPSPRASGGLPMLHCDRGCRSAPTLVEQVVGCGELPLHAAATGACLVLTSLDLNVPRQRQ